MSNPTPQPRPAPASAPRPAAAPAPKPSKLAGITAAALPNARRFFLYGVRKWGKSTWAADAPSPIFIDTMNATEHLHVARYPHDGQWTWQDVLNALEDLLVSPHSYATVVIEDVGDLEAIIWRHMFETVPAGQGVRATTIEDYGYGKGYKIANQFWRQLSERLDALRLKRRMHVILLGHSAIQTQKNPAGPDFDTYQPAIYKEAAGILGADFDLIGFATFTDETVGVGGKVPKKVIGATGERVVRLSYNAAWPMVGSRLPMGGDVEVQLEHPFAPFAAAMAQASMTPAMLRQKIDAELGRLGESFLKANGTEATADGVRSAVAKAGDDFDALSRYLTTLRQAQPMPTDSKEQTP